MQTAIPCMILRGGTSKGLDLLASDLPRTTPERDAILLAAMGSPDPRWGLPQSGKYESRQIDGVGGAHPLTSKVALVSASTEPGIDIDFLFAQVGLDTPTVDTTPNCGNILAGVGPFAIERGLIAATHGETRVRVRTINTGTVAELIIATPGGHVAYGGDARIDGVPGHASPIAIDFLDAAGSVCGALLPTGRPVDHIAGVEVTLIDNGMPVIVIAAEAVGRTGHEPRDQLNADAELKARIEAIRLLAGPMMNLGDVTRKVVPKIALVAAPRAGGAITTRSFIPHECHASIGVFAAVSVATAAIMPGSPANRVAVLGTGSSQVVSVEHPTGELSVRIEIEPGDTYPRVVRAGLLRTARLIFDGHVYVPSRLLAPA